MVKYLYRLDIKQVFLLCILLSIMLTISSFILEYGFGAVPCRMCWWQRYGHWAIGIMGLMGYISSYWVTSQCFLKSQLKGICLIAVAMFGIAFYQSLGQLGFVQLPAVCGSAGHRLAENGEELLALLQAPQNLPDCSSWGFVILGLSLAMWNVLVMGGLAAFLTKWFIVSKSGNVKK